MERPSVSISVSTLLDGFGSGTVPGAVTEAVLTSRPPDNDELTFPRTKKVTLLPAGMLTVVLMSPEPPLAPTVAPPVPKATQVALRSAPERLSVTVAALAPTTPLGPLLVTTMV